MPFKNWIGEDKMLQRYSEQLTEFLMIKGIIQSENREIYEYGFVALLSTVINIIIVLTIGITAGIFLETIIFMFMFGILRVYCGGYHAESHITCVLVFIGIYGLAMTVVKFLPEEACGIFSVLAGVISFVFILFLAPIEHKNKPFIGDEYSKFRTISRIIAALELMAIFLITVLFSETIKVAVLISLAMLGVTFILILAKVEGKRR
jgi:accessory gene regulator B